MQEKQVQSLGWEDSLEKGITAHSSILAWKIPWTEELGGLCNKYQFLKKWNAGHELSPTLQAPPRSTETEI